MHLIDIRKDNVDPNYLVEYVTKLQQPILIIGEGTNAVLLSQEDWDGIQATLHLIKIPDVHRSIKQAMAEPLAKSRKSLKF